MKLKGFLTKHLPSGYGALSLVVIGTMALAHHVATRELISHHTKPRFAPTYTILHYTAPPFHATPTPHIFTASTSPFTHPYMHPSTPIQVGFVSDVRSVSPLSASLAKGRCVVYYVRLACPMAVSVTWRDVCCHCMYSMLFFTAFGRI